MNATRTIVCYFGLAAAALVLQAHTTAESNAVVRAALLRVAYGGSCRPHIDLPPPDYEPPNTWHGFLGGDTNGWTLADKKAAFDWYLGTLGAKNCRLGGIVESDEIDAAISRCQVLYYTNAVPSLKALALNPNGVMRDEAITVAMKFSPVDDSTTQFVESIITNVNGYSSGERVGCYIEYSKKLLQDPCTNGVFANALSMFYRNRKADYTGAVALDRLFSEKIANYSQSFNRLDTVMHMFTATNMHPRYYEYFANVTNQLLSSGRPLVQLDIGEGGK